MRVADESEGTQRKSGQIGPAGNSRSAFITFMNWTGQEDTGRPDREREQERRQFTTLRLKKSPGRASLMGGHWSRGAKQPQFSNCRDHPQ